MNRTFYYSIVSLTLLALLLISGLYWNAERPYKIKNGFNRKNIAVLKKTLALKVPSEMKSLVFDGQHRVYFCNEVPDKIWRLNIINMKLDTLLIPWPKPVQEKLSFKLMATEKELYLQYQNQQAIFCYDLVAATVERHSLIRTPSQQVLTGGQQLVMRCGDFGSRKPILLKQGLKAGGMKAIKKPWENEKKGLIPTDGELHFDWITGLISYHYFYKNGFLVLDSDLNKITNGKTIDTVEKGMVKVKLINDVFTLKAPPRIVNGHGFAANGKLFLNGYLKAENEDVKDFRNHTVIDVYDMLKGIYLYSFYVPVFNERKTNRFVISGDLMVCLYGDHVVIYRIKAVALADNRLTPS